MILVISESKGCALPSGTENPLLRCDAVWSVMWVPLLRRYLFPPASWCFYPPWSYKCNRASSVVGAFSLLKALYRRVIKWWLSWEKLCGINWRKVRPCISVSSLWILGWVPCILMQSRLINDATAVTFSTQQSRSTSWEADSWSASNYILNPPPFPLSCFSNELYKDYPHLPTHFFGKLP